MEEINDQESEGKKRFITWEEVNLFIDRVYKKYYNNNYKGVYGIPRGGLILAVMLSHKLHIPLLMAPTPDCLIVDDIADSGKTLLHYDTLKCNIVTLAYEVRSLVIPDYYLIKKENDNWIIFPWEVDDWEEKK